MTSRDADRLRPGPAAISEDSGTITILLTGVLAIILMVTALGAAITGVHVERNALQHAADGAALAGSQAVDESSLYREGEQAVTTPQQARASAEEFLRRYPLESSRMSEVRIAEVTVEDDGTVAVRLTGATDPPLIGWFTDGAGWSIPLDATGEARAR